MTAREIDAALGADPDFADVCDERDARYHTALAALDHDTAADAMDLAAGEVVS